MTCKSVSTPITAVTHGNELNSTIYLKTVELKPIESIHS